MKLFGYNFKIEKSVSDKRIIIRPKPTNGKVNCIAFFGSDWTLHDKIDMKIQTESWIEQIETNVPSLLAKDIVKLLNIFAGKLYKFELEA